MPTSIEAMRGAARSAASIMASIETCVERPASTCWVTPTSARTSKPACTAARTSGTSDMPTRSAPAWRRKRYSARVGIDGPGMAANTPVAHGTPARSATSRATSIHCRR